MISGLYLPKNSVMFYKSYKMKLKVFVILMNIAMIICHNDLEESDHGVKYANKCEICKILTKELELRLDETGRTHQVLEMGYALDDIEPKKKRKYEKSELRLIESMENICDKILEYNIHKEREDSTRFDKGMSQTFKTLHGLVDKGVKVELGIPYELWDKPSVEITQMKQQCETMLENYEDAIEDWYWNHQKTMSLTEFFCKRQVLLGDDDKCLDEKIKGDSGEKTEL